MKHGGVHWTRRSALWALVLVVALAGAGSGSASKPTTTSGPLRIDLFVDLDGIDPALTYGFQSWQLEFATCAKLVNYPGAPAPEGTRLFPEIAAGFPTISRGARRT